MGHRRQLFYHYAGNMDKLFGMLLNCRGDLVELMVVKCTKML